MGTKGSRMNGRWDWRVYTIDTMYKNRLSRENLLDSTRNPIQCSAVTWKKEIQKEGIYVWLIHFAVLLKQYSTVKQLQSNKN